MPGLEVTGRWMVILGITLALVGGVLWLVGRLIPAGQNFPGTIRINGSGFTCIIPLLASILLSILLTVILNLLARFFNR